MKEGNKKYYLKQIKVKLDRDKNLLMQIKRTAIKISNLYIYYYFINVEFNVTRNTYLFCHKKDGTKKILRLNKEACRTADRTVRLH